MSRPPLLGVHSARLERWLGAAAAEQLSSQFRSWYGPPVAVAGVPGRVYVCGGGDLRGRVDSGAFAAARDVADGAAARFRRALRVAGDPSRLNAGFASLSDFIVQFSTPSKRRQFPFFKVGPSGTAGAAASLWQSIGGPGAGAAGSASPGGRACDDMTAGAMSLMNAAGGQTMKYVSSSPIASVAANTLLLYDRLFDVAKNMNSNATEAVTGVPTRYQSTVSTNEDWAGGNFAFPEVQGVLAATGHNWTVCQYTDDAGNAAQSFPSIAGVASAAAQRIDLLLGAWFMPLAAGDFGLTRVTQMQLSAAVATGTANFVIGHPIAVMPCPIAGQVTPLESTAYAFERIFDDACLSFLELPKPSGTATNYSGFFTACCS